MATNATSLMTVVETSERLNCSIGLVYKLVRRGDLPCIRVGDAIRISAEDLAAYLVERNDRS